MRQRVNYSCHIAGMHISVLWNSFKKASWKSITVAFNNAFHIIFKLNRLCSASAMFVNNNVNSFIKIQTKIIFRFLV